MSGVAKRGGGGGGRRLAVRAAALLSPVAAAACGGPHTAFDPAADAAAAIADLGWLLLAVCATVFVVVMVLYAVAVARRRPPAGDGVAEPDGPGAVRAVVAGGVATALVLAWLTGLTVVTSGRLEQAAGPGEAGVEPLEVHVTGRQFWWEVRYPASGVVTANELHLPAGRPARLHLASGDVIHSFWVPRLNGKRDMTPGRRAELVLAPREPGVYRGFCSEFCGVQHALMGLLVVAEPPERFEAWLAEQAAPAHRPPDEVARRGEQVFVAAGCQVCHQVRGLDLEGPADVGPDLTHLASRRTLAAAALDNTPEVLAAWITDPHALKPGVRMPPTSLATEDLEALVAFLGSLR